jgi:tetratricopeptide (TPR) repeat protein
VVVCALCLVGDANGQTASELASRAAQAMQSGDYAEAEKMFVRLESLAPGVPEVKSNLGLARYYGKKPDLARKDFVRALALNSNLFVSNFYLAMIDCEEGKYAEAIPFLRKAVKLQPQEPASRSLLADVLSRVGSRTEAIAQYRELLKQQPQNAGFLSGLAEVYLDQTRQSAQLLKQADPRFAALLKAESDSALSEWKSVAPERWQKALSVLPLFPGPRIRFADFLWSIDRFSESESPLQEELKIDPFSYKALFRLGQLKLRNGDLIAAAEYLEHSAQIRPEFFDPLPHLSIGPEHPEKYYAPFEPVDDNATFGRAFVMSELASKINPPANDSGWLSTALKRRTDLRLKIRSRLDVAKAPVGIEQRRTTGLKYLREKRLDEGLLLLLPIARTKTTDSELRIAVGRALAEADRPQELAASLGGAQASDAETLYHLVSSYKMLTADTIDKLVKNDPHAVELQKLNAESLADRNMFKEAAEQYRSALESRPDDPELYFGLGEAHFNQMQFDEAERAYGHAIELKPSDPAFYIMRASALVELHRAEEAMSLSRRALELNPKMLQAHVSLGRALALLGRDQEAAQELELAARTDTDGMLHYNLFKLYRNLGRSEEAKGALKTSNELRSRQPGGSESSAKPSVAENPVMKE